MTEEGEAVFNEINTLPGLLLSVMYPMLFEAEGIEKTELITRLIENGLAGMRLEGSSLQGGERDG